MKAEGDLATFVGAGPRPARPAEGRRWFHRHDPRASPARVGRGPAPTNAGRSAVDFRPSCGAARAQNRDEKSPRFLKMMRTKTDVSGGLSAVPVLRRETSPA